jgi:hypothetical protein
VGFPLLCLTISFQTFDSGQSWPAAAKQPTARCSPREENAAKTLPHARSPYTRGAAGPKRCGKGDGHRLAAGAAAQGRRRLKAMWGRDSRRPAAGAAAQGRRQPKAMWGRDGRRAATGSRVDLGGREPSLKSVFFYRYMVFLTYETNYGRKLWFFYLPRFFNHHVPKPYY